MTPSNETSEKIRTATMNITILLGYGICQSCGNYIPIDDSRIPQHFHCSKLFQYLDFPKAINEVHLGYDENDNPYCFSFIPRKKEKCHT